MCGAALRALRDSAQNVTRVNWTGKMGWHGMKTKTRVGGVEFIVSGTDDTLHFQNTYSNNNNNKEARKYANEMNPIIIIILISPNGILWWWWSKAEHIKRH